MATFTNFARLNFNGGSTESNIVTGELLETLTLTKTAVRSSYAPRGSAAYVLSLNNSGTSPLTGLTITDDLGGYSSGGTTVYPLSYNSGTIQYYVNGVLQTAPTVTAGPPMTMAGITVPAGGNVMLVYEATATEYAPLGSEAEITNTATATGGGLAAPLTAQETIGMEQRADLSISKAICPASVSENGQLTYTFVIRNGGSAEAGAGENIALSDVFDPRLKNITVTFNGTAWAETANYTYNTETGEFATVAGQITVPAAAYSQNSDGTWTVTPGSSTLTVTGTV